MDNAAPRTLGEFRAGAVLSTVFAVFLRNLLPFLALAALVMVPSLAYSLAITPAVGFFGALAALSTGDFTAAGGALLDFALGYLLTATVVHGTYQHLRGRRVRVFDSLARALPLLGTVLVLAVILTVAISVGLAAVVVPGLILFTMFAAAVPAAAVVERTGAVASLKRSAALTEGVRGRVFAVVAAMFAVSWAMSLGIGFLFVLGMAGKPGPSLLWVMVAAGYLETALTSAFGAVTYTVLYHHLRLAKEGGDVEQIAAVFD